MLAGDYPLSATIATEYSPTRWRGAFVASVFAMQVCLCILQVVIAMLLALS